MKKTYTKEEIARARAQMKESTSLRREAWKVLRTTMKRHRFINIYGLVPKLERRVKKLETAVAKLLAKKTKATK
jgi:hypothetical protein